ncbi:hypothetical protein [Okeania sp. SIO2C2]|nr:hypothetical protein [Okeania sp. SIO2C2]
MKKESGVRSQESGEESIEEGVRVLHKCAWDFNSFVEVEVE